MLNQISSVLQQSANRNPIVLALTILASLWGTNTYAMADVSKLHVLPCEIVWQYYRQTCEWDTGAVHVGIKNTSEHSVEIEKLTIDDKILAWPESLANPQNAIEASKKKKRRYFPEDTKEGDIMWFRFSQKVMSPGTLTELIIKFQKPPQKAVELEIETKAGEVIRITIEPEVAPISISAITFSENLSQIYVYVKNLSQQEQSLESIEINGQDKTTDSTFVNRLITPGRSGCVVVPAPEHLAKGDYVYVSMKTRDGIVTGNSIRAFSNFIVPEQPKNVELKHYTDDPYGQLDLVARKILQEQPVLQGSEMIQYWSNQGFIKYGIMAFGELVDCAQVHCQPTEVEYLGKYRSQDPHYVQAKVRYIREALAPRPLFPQTEVHHALMGAFAQGLLSPAEMRLRVYYMISRGAKGLFYRGSLEKKSTPHQHKMLKAEMDRIQNELIVLKPLLQIGENIDNQAICSEPLVEPATLLCGDNAIIVVLFNHDRQMSWPKNEMYLGDSFWIEPKPDQFDVTVSIPPEVKVRQVFEVGGKWSRPDFNTGGHNCRFAIDGIVDSRIFVLSFNDHIKDDIISRRSHNALPGPASVNNKGNMEDIDLMISNLVNTEILGTSEGPWKPTRLADLQADFNGPDIQFEEKQYFFGQIQPDNKPHWYDFYYQNIGKKPLEVTLLKKSDDSQVEIKKPLLFPGEKANIRVGFMPNTKKHIKVFLKTNDSNEEKICLEIGGNVSPDFILVPESLHFIVDHLSEEDPSKTVRLIDNSKVGNINIQNIKTNSDYIDCTLSPIRKDRVIVRSHADIFEGEYVQREFTLQISLEKDGVEKSTNESITVTTDRGDISQIPVTIELVNPVVCVPSRLFFGTVTSSVSKDFEISSQRLPLKIKEVTSDDSCIEINISEIEDQKCYKISATIKPTQREGVIRDEIKVVVVCGDREYFITVPYFALVQ